MTSISRGAKLFLLCVEVFLLWQSPAKAFGEEIQNLGVSDVSASAGNFPAEVSGVTEVFPEAWEGRGLGVAEVLSALPGIQSHAQGGMGSFQTVSIRGVSARNVLVCIDGMPVNGPDGGAADLGAIDLNNVEKIEVYKDRVPARFGGSGLGGVINFVTKNTLSAGAKPYAHVLLGYGSHNTFEGAVQAGGRPSDSLLFSATASVRHSDNDYEFMNRNGTAYNREDDFTDRRENAEFTEYSVGAQYRMLHRGGNFSTLSFRADRTEAGNPGREDSQTKVASFTGMLYQLAYRLELPELWERLTLEPGIAGRFEKNEATSYYPLDHVGYLNNEFLASGLAGYRLAPELSGALDFGRLGAEFRIAGSVEDYRSRGATRGFEVTRFSGSVAGNIEYVATRFLRLAIEGNVLKTLDDIDGGRFLLTTGVETVEDAEKRDLSFAGMLRADVGSPEFPAGLSLSLGRFYRQPQLMELYGVTAGTLSNPSLKDESALRLEAGAYARSPSGKTKLSVTYFETFLKNGIYWISSANLMKAFNASEAHIRGVEVELRSRPAEFFETTIRTTLQDPRDEGRFKLYRGKLLPGESVRSDYTEAKVFLPFHLDLAFSVSARSRMYHDRANQHREPPAVRYNASLGFSPMQKTRIVLALLNLSDETYCNIYSPYPTPGREYRLTFTQGF